MRLRRLEHAVAHVQQFAQVWLDYGKLIEAARKAEHATAAQEAEFAKATGALVKHYRACLRLMENADLPGHRIIWRSLQSGTLAEIAGMPNGPFEKYWEDWQGGYRTLQEFTAFLQAARLDLLDMPRWRYYLQLVTGSKLVRVAAVLLVVVIVLSGLGKFGFLNFATDATRSVEVVRIVGRVEVKGEGKTEWRGLKEGEQVVPGDTIRCGPGALVDLKSDDATTLRVEPGSELKIERSLLSRLTSFRTLAVRLLHGEVYVVAKETRAGREVEVHTAEGVSRIGKEKTTAAVSHSDEGGTSSTVYDGEMQMVSPLQRALMLHAGDDNLFYATARIEIRYRQATPTQTPLLAVGWVERAGESRAIVKGELRLEDGTVLASCESLIVRPQPSFLEGWTEEAPYWRVYSEEEIAAARSS